MNKFKECNYLITITVINLKSVDKDNLSECSVLLFNTSSRKSTPTYQTNQLRMSKAAFGKGESSKVGFYIKDSFYLESS